MTTTTNTLRPDGRGSLAARVGASVLFVALIWLTNWFLINVGEPAPGGGPRLLPVGLGLLAPSGVYLAGLTFCARDLVHRLGGARWSVAAILVGAALSAFLSGPLALASGAAFLAGELVDLGVFVLILDNWRGYPARWPLAVALSNVGGLLIDSLIFLPLAGIPLDYLPGQALGKLWATAALLAIWAAWTAVGARRRRGAACAS